MGLSDALRRLRGTRPTFQGQEIVVSYGQMHDEVLGMHPAEVWRTQPHLRTVVTFMARNIAQLGLHTFQRAGETDRQRIRDGAVAATLRRPNANTTSFELVYGLVADLALYDVGYWHFRLDADAESGWSIYRLPPDWVTPQGGDAFSYKTYRVQANGGASWVDLPAESVIDFHGWNPTDPRYGSSPVAALKAILAEQMMAVKYRQGVWQRGGKVSAVITRPQGAVWSPEARESFRADWNSKYTGDGPAVGGTPILEDGMTINKLDFNAHEQQFVEAAKLALTTVASVYHVNPTMIGVLDNANYSNVREFRKMLYGDTLGPVIAMIEDRINTFLVPKLDPRDGLYVEFNIAEKLQGNFEEQAQALQASVGAPYMLRSEARALSNLPAIEGADELIVPLNVLVGGQASPQDSAPKAYQEVLRGFLKRQMAVVKTRMGATSDWWDQERWDTELADDLYRLSKDRELATRFGRAFNATTRDLIDNALRTGGDVNAVFEARLANPLEGL
jgi:HK97 family phage portal protein